MKKTLGSAALASGLAALSLGASAADQAKLQIVQSEEFGSHLADSEGRALYLFTADTQGESGQQPQVSCTGECLDAWPPLYTAGKPQAGDEIDDRKLGTIEHNGETMVTYNGWPLYYFAEDRGSGQATGQDVESFGGEWYLVAPGGEKVENE